MIQTVSRELFNKNPELWLIKEQNQLYQSTEFPCHYPKFKCEIIGMHSIYEGNLIDNLISYAVMIDDKYQNDLQEIKNLSDYFAEVATKQSLVYDHLSKEELKKKVLEWECYQFFNFFKLAQMDWRPTEQMFEAIRNKDVPNRFELSQFPSFKEYTTSPEFEIYWLKDLYQ